MKYSYHQQLARQEMKMIDPYNGAVKRAIRFGMIVSLIWTASMVGLLGCVISAGVLFFQKFW